MDAIATEKFESQLVDLLPSMRRWALALTRNAPAADDLVQDVAMKVWVRETSFNPGTNFKAWVHRIMVNHFISGMRTQRDFVSVDVLADIPVAPEQPGKIDLEKLSVEFDRLPDYMKDTLREIAIEDRTYEEISARSGCSIGTLKSRVHRARVALRARMDGSERLAA